MIEGGDELPDLLTSTDGTGDLVTLADRYEDRELLSTTLTLKIIRWHNPTSPSAVQENHGVS